MAFDPDGAYLEERPSEFHFLFLCVRIVLMKLISASAWYNNEIYVSVDVLSFNVKVSFKK